MKFNQTRLGLRPAHLSPSQMAKLSLFVLGIALAANALFNAVMLRTGAGYYYTSFLFNPSDRWADFYKLIASFPISELHPPSFAWNFQDHLDDLYAEAGTKLGGPINPDHLPPLSTLITVLARYAAVLVDPVVIYASFFSGAVALLCKMIGDFAQSTGDRSRWVMVVLLAYPVWFAVDRGHMFSMICAITLMAATWRMVRSGRVDAWSLLLLAIAINLRPNVAAVPALLILSGRTGKIRDLPLLGGLSAILLVAAMTATHELYPHYGWETWMRGLADYRQQYIIAPINHGYTSSLVIVLELAFGYAEWIPPSCLILGGAISAATVVAGRTARIGSPELLFVGLAVMSIATPGFGDYHLIPYLLPPLLIAANGGVAGRSESVVFTASLIMLIPKNYAFGLDAALVPWSYQILINPLVLLIATLIVLFDAFARRADAPPAGDHDPLKTAA